MTTLGADNPLETDVVAAVRQAAEAAPKRPRSGGFSLLVGSPVEAIFAPLVGLYLGYAVVRLPEVFQEVAIPHLPMILMLTFLAILGFAIPASAWKVIWHRAKSLRIVSGLLGLAIITAPIGIWPSESLQFVREHYIVSVGIFITCLAMLRDRRNLRTAVSVYVLCTSAVCVDVLHTYDPNGVFYNDEGDPISPEVLEVRPELKRLRSVGVSLDPNDFGAILATTFPLALWLSVGSFRRRVFWTGIAGLMVAAVVPTQSRGSELGFIAVAVVIVTLGSRGWRRWMSAALVVGCVGLFLMMASGIGAGGRFADFGASDYNVAGNEGRMFFWRQGIVWMLKRPWGYGIINYSTYFGMLNGAERAAHSSWVQYGVELGVAGLALFIMLCAGLVKGLRRLLKKATALRGQHPAAMEEGILAGHMLAVLAGVLVTGSFLSNAYYPMMYMALGMAGATLLGSPLADVQMATPALPAAPGHPRSRRRLRNFAGQAPAG